MDQQQPSKTTRAYTGDHPIISDQEPSKRSKGDQQEEQGVNSEGNSKEQQGFTSKSGGSNKMGHQGNVSSAKGGKLSSKGYRRH